jgi:hypothetical protein
MATWFNLALITSEIPDRSYPPDNGPLVLFTATLYTTQGQRLSLHLRAVSLARALEPIAELGKPGHPTIARNISAGRPVPLRDSGSRLEVRR